MPNSSSMTVTRLMVARESQLPTAAGAACGISSGCRSGNTAEKQPVSRCRTSSMKHLDTLIQGRTVLDKAGPHQAHRARGRCAGDLHQELAERGVARRRAEIEDDFRDGKLLEE